MCSGSSWTTRAVIVGVACVLLAGTTGALERSEPGSERESSRLAALEERANQVMGLLASEVVSLSITARIVTDRAPSFA